VPGTAGNPVGVVADAVSPRVSSRGPLKKLNCDYSADRDAKILRSIKTLDTINEKPAKEVLK